MQNNYHNNYSGSNNVTPRPITGDALLKKISPDMQAERAKVWGITIFMIILILGCIALAVLGATVFAKPWGFSGTMTQPNFAIMIPGAFGTVIMIGLTAGFSGYQFAKLSKINETIREIKARDKALISDLMLAPVIGTGMMVAVVRKLIDTGNLSGYTMVGDIAVAKTELNLRESDFIVSGTVVRERVVEKVIEKKARPTRCPSCGGSIGQDERYCPYCGGKL